MTAIAALFAVVLVVAMLAGLCLLSWALAEGLYIVAPAVASSILGRPITFSWKKQEQPAKPQRRTPADQMADRMAPAAKPEHELPSVVLCRNPISKPTYFVAMTKRRLLWSWRKSNAKQFAYDEKILQSWMQFLEQRGERNVFVVFAAKGGRL